MSLISTTTPASIHTTTKQPTKSILKQTNSNTTTSWFSKFNNNNDSKTTNANTTPTTPPISPRINSLFNSFRKQPAQQQQRLLQQKQSVDDLSILSELGPKELKRVRFPVNDMTKEYLFKREDLVTEKKNQVEIEPINIQTTGQLLTLYELLCKKKQEKTIDLVVSALITQPQATFLTKLDLTNQSMDRYNIDPLCDIMSIEFGLKELILSNCGLDDDATKILMHSLLNNDKIEKLNLSNNIKLTTNGFKYIAVYIKGSNNLNYLDLSYTQPDKKGIQYIMSSTTIKPSCLKTLLFNGCGLRNQQLEVIATYIRKSSSINHLYLRSNKFMNGGSLSIGVMLRDYDDNIQIETNLTRLFLDDNDLSQGIQYITQALKRNQSLLTLSICDCKIDAKGCILVGEALKYNQHLERFDIGYNPLCTPNMDGITSIRQALNVNRSLKDLRLADTGLGTEAAIALAECLPENNSIIRLDLSRNPKIDIAGLLGISVSIRMNHTITFIDINIPTDDKEMVEIHNGILATCTRNAQLLKDKATTETKDTSISSDNESITQLENPLISTTQATARLTLQERLAAVTKGKALNNKTMSASSSEVTACTTQTTELQPPKEPKRKVHVAELIQQAFDTVGLLEDALASKEENNSPSSLLDDCKRVQAKICARIPSITDPSQLEILLAVNDRLTTATENFDTVKTVEMIDSNNDSAVAFESSEQQQQKEEPPVTGKEKAEDTEKGEYNEKTQEEQDNVLSSSFEIGDDEDEDDLDEIDEEEYENHLKELRSEIEAEESAAFLKAKKQEEEQKAKAKELAVAESNVEVEVVKDDSE